MRSGGYQASRANNPADPHMMIVGRLGQGEVSITGGAMMVTEAATGVLTTQSGPIAVSLGSTPYSFTFQTAPDQGGKAGLRVGAPVRHGASGARSGWWF